MPNVAFNPLVPIPQTPEEIERERIIRENKSSVPIMVSTNKGGDTHVSNSTTNVSGEPNTDHSETTQKLLTYAI